MKKDKHKTDVKFLVNTQPLTCPGLPGEIPHTDIFAFFPSEIDSKKYNIKTGETVFYTCYSHVGQHSGCALEYANESRTATAEEREPLIKELESIGYNLNILN